MLRVVRFYRKPMHLKIIAEKPAISMSKLQTSTQTTAHAPATTKHTHIHTHTHTHTHTHARTHTHTHILFPIETILFDAQLAVSPFGIYQSDATIWCSAIIRMV
jgi:ABC-type Zn2+ transport system substrate-binding protein/surface adhesin